MGRGTYRGQNRHGLPSEYKELAWVASPQGLAANKLEISLYNNNYPFGFEMAVHVEDDSNDQLLGGFYFFHPVLGTEEYYIRKNASNAASNANCLVVSYSIANGGVAEYDFRYNPKSYWNTIKLYNKTLTRCDGSTTTVADTNLSSTASKFGFGATWKYSTAGHDYVTPTSNKTFYIAHLKVWYRTSVWFDLYPCQRRSDGKVGFYDIQGSTFYPSDTSTEFVAGPSV